MLKLILYIFAFYLVYQFIKLILVLSRGRNRQDYTFRDEPKPRKDGETSIHYIPEDEPRNGSDPAGKDEYIDYKEVK